MALTRPFPIDQAYPNAGDLRKHGAAIYPREGVFPDAVTVAAAGIAYGNGGWNVGARPFVANTKRGAAPFTQAYGSAQIGNDAAGTAWTIGAAPASGTRVDRLWIKALDPTQGDALDGSTPPRAVPAYGVTAGTPAIQPLPAGCVEIAQVSTPSTATSIAQSTIVQTYAFAHVLGSPLYFRTKAAADAAAAAAAPGELAYVIATGLYYQRASGGGWAPLLSGGVTTATLGPDGNGAVSNSRIRLGPDGYVDFEALTNRTNSTTYAGQLILGVFPEGFRPLEDSFALAATYGSGARNGATINAATGVMSLDTPSPAGHTAARVHGRFRAV